MTEGDQAIHQYREAAADVPRNAAAERLAVVVERIARQVARAVSARSGDRQLGQDLCDEAVAKVWQNLEKYNARQPPFERWCYRVLRNLAWDLRKKKRPEPLPRCPATHVELDPEDPRWAADRQRLERRLDGPKPFSPEDLELLGRAPEKRRVVVLALSGLYAAVATERWEAWCGQCDIAQPFPPAEMLDEEDVAGRVETLAAHLAMRTDAVWRHWYRGLTLLRELPYGQAK